MKPESQELHLRIEGGGTVRVSLADGTVAGLDEVLENLSPGTAVTAGLALNKVGETFEYVENHEAASRVYAAAVRLMEASGSRLYTALMLSNQALAVKRNGQVEDALALYERAAALLRDPEDSAQGESERIQLLARILFNVAVLRQGRGETVEAERSAKWALELVEYNDDEVSRAVAEQCRQLLHTLRV